MTSYLALRAGKLLLLLGISSFLVFVGLRLAPGDPVVRFAGPYASDERRAEVRKELGLDRPIVVQYGVFIADVFRGDLGRSLFFRAPVADVIKRALGPSLTLGFLALALSYVIAIPLGVLAARYHNRPFDHAIRFATSLGVAVPNFWLALLLVLVFGVYLRVLPVGGTGSPEHLVLPVIAVAAEGTAVSTRLMRASMLETLRLDFVRAMRAQGLSEFNVVYVRALRTALLPTISFFGLRLGWILAAQVVVEYVFSWPGVGRLIVDAILARDYPLVQASALLFITVVVLGNFVADFLYAVADPRTRR